MAVEPRRVLLTGPAGVGKSRLAAEIAARVRPGSGEVVTITATPTARDIPYGAFTAVVGTLDRSSASSRGPLAQSEFLASAYDSARVRLAEAVIVVDDVDQLDTSSSVLLGLLLTNDDCAAVMTARSGSSLPDAVERLWASGAFPL